MGLSPDDIVNYPLKQAVRGYSVPQVDELLDQVADTVERLTSEVEDLRRRLRQSEDRLAAASETESTLKRTLVTAQRAAEQSLDEAREQATGLVEEARRASAGILEAAELDAQELREEAVKAARAEEAEIRRRRQALEGHIEALRIFEREYRARLRGHLEDQLRTLDDVPVRIASGGGVPRLEEPDGPADDVPGEPSPLGSASVPDEPEELRVRVRDGLGGSDVDHRRRAPVDDLDDDLDDEFGGGDDDGGVAGAGEVGSRPSEEAREDEARTERRGSVP